MSDTLRAAVFDLDGTLADSAPDIAAALNGTLGAAGLRPLDLETIKTLVGGGAHTLIERALARLGEHSSEARLETLLAGFLRRYRAEPCLRTTLYPGTREALVALASRDVRLGICTNKPADLTELVLSGLGVREMFASVVAASPALPPKPAPHMLLRALEQLGAPADAAVMVGDSAADVGVARAARVRCILLRHGYSAVGVDELQADAVLDGFSGLLQELARMSGRLAPEAEIR